NQVVVAVSGAGGISVLDTGENSLIATIATGSRPICVTGDPARNRIYVANEGSQDVSVVEPAGAGITVTKKIAVGHPAQGVVFHPATNTLLVADYLGQNLIFINTATDTVSRVISIR